MKKSDELKQKRAAREAEIEPLVKKAANELTADERKTLEAGYTELEQLDADIDLQVKNENFEANRAARNGQPLSEGEKKDIRAYSFARAIQLRTQGKQLDGIEGEMDAEGRKERDSIGIRTSENGFVVPMMVLRNVGVTGEKRASAGQNVTTVADGGYLVQDEAFVFIEALQNALVINGLGVRMLPGLVGNLPLVKGGSFTASWVAEGSNVSFTKEAFSKATMQPKNLMIAGAISNQLLKQTNGIAENILRNDLIMSIAAGIQLAAINGSGSDAPTGILNTSGIGSVAMGTNGAVPTWGKIVDLETSIADNNAQLGQISYLTNSKVRGYLKQTLKANGVAGYMMEGNNLNGYQTAVTNAVPSNLTKGESGAVCSAIIAGVFSEMFIGMWGGLDVIVDQYTRADYNETKLVFNQFADIALRNAKSFAAIKDALTA